MTRLTAAPSRRLRHTHNDCPDTLLGRAYLFKRGLDYKNWRTGDLERRFKAIEVAMPERLERVHSIRTDDPVGIESDWHRRFAEKRRNGEWFRLKSPDVTDRGGGVTITPGG